MYRRLAGVGVEVPSGSQIRTRLSQLNLIILPATSSIVLPFGLIEQISSARVTQWLLDYLVH
jgi:hypothetical protein